jgi:V/A-type H+-transporting ATPase subunit B
MTSAQWPSLITKEYRTVSRIAGPLIFVERIRGVAYGEIVEITGPAGEVRLGQVLEVDRQRIVRSAPAA